MLKHVVFMKFKKDAADADIVDLEKGLSKLPGMISEIKGYEFGRDIVHSERSYDFALVSAFDDLESMKRYQVHPEHVAVIGKVKALCDSILAVDFEY
ncbi:Dabb family protein [Desulforhabdus amnigena]|jgi:hypothetical protein|uniref:Stress responsive protein n=1 Tax=Desulforhabdus amnigena TaxID=40218 RepID=A0A9W6CXZ6_9BACT|nr:Dabb family protein [Desulforhabdus amnigena]NLJ28600.1 Dabb family protein [Deltaproteobacteria bacterium]GLI33871.1 stress responsive protein [Desulforhabdus amnigena]